MNEQSADEHEDLGFTYRTGKDGVVFLFWRGKQVMILRGSDAQRFMERVAEASEAEAQLLMAHGQSHWELQAWE
ncbi:MAG: hypothetical protein Fur005_05450 [Roseiflexaceae bacterium]